MACMRARRTALTTFHLPAPWIRKVDDWRSLHFQMYQPDRLISRSAAIRILIESGLTATQLDWEKVKKAKDDPFRMDFS